MHNTATVTDTPDPVLIAALQQGQPEALSKLYDKYAPVLMGLISRMVPDSEMAETVLQKTFAGIWLQRESYSGTSLRFLSWIILIARDVAKTALAPTQIKGFTLTKENRNFAEMSGILPLTSSTETSQLKEFSCRLSQNERMALDLVYLKGYSCDMAATSLGISVEALKTCLKTAIKQLGSTSEA